MHPAIGLPLERYTPPSGATLCGFHLPPHTNVGMSAPLIHRNQSIYGPDADSFRPERWLESSPDQLRAMDRSFFVFGHGSRTCIGKNISMMEMGKLVPQILRKFDVEWASEKPDWDVKTYFFSRQTGLVTRFVPKGKSTVR